MSLADAAPTVADPSAAAPDDAPAAPFVFPPGSRVVHIGPHKTGTTSLQAALHASRPALLRQGVRYAGRDSKSADAVRAVRGVPAPSGRVPAMSHWKDLVREAGASGEGRWVLSNEFLADAPEGAIRTIARDLGPDRVQVVLTLRPLARILPSQWQQYVQGGLSTAWEPWLRDVLDAPAGERPTGFWRRHRHDHLLGRWADVVGADRVTALVVREEPSWLLRVFEGLLGLEARTLAAEDDPRNRSMTLPEIEAVRAVNAEFEAAGLPSSLHYRAIQRGAAERIKARQPSPDEPRVTIPGWALDRVSTLASEIVAGVERSGARVVGDIAALAHVPARGGEPAAGVAAIPAEVVAALSMGLLEAAGLAAGSSRRSPSLLRRLGGVARRAGRRAGLRAIRRRIA